MKRSKSGVSLIVLVITIIIMIILAAAVIITLNNSNIIERADEAVTKTELSQMQQLATIIWTEAYADGKKTKPELEQEVINGLKANGFTEETLSNYTIDVTTKGVTVKVFDKKWVKKGATVVRGDQVLTIGDTIEYDETKEGTISVPKDVTWQVLGVDDAGNLLILSNELGTYINCGPTLEELKTNFPTWVSQLDATCEPYGNGEGAIGTPRAIREEDFYKIADAEKTVEQEIIAFKYNGTNTPAYSSSKSGDGTVIVEHKDGFIYFDGTNWGELTEKELLDGTIGDTFATVTINRETYSTGYWTITSKEEYNKASDMLGIGGSSRFYWVANTNQSFSGHYIGWSYAYVVNYGLYSYGDFYSHLSYTEGGNSSTRAVVTLSQDVMLEGDSDTGWIFKK